MIVTRRAAGWSPACIAEQLGISRATVHKWLARYRREGEAGLADRSSRPHRILAVRREVRRGPVHLSGLPIRRHSGIRYERPRPGDLLHVNVKKLGRVPDGGGWRVHGRSEAVRGRGIGYDYLHVAVDDHTRIAYVEALPDEKDRTCAGFLHRAVAWFRDHGVTVLRVLTDNAKVYRVGSTWRAVCVALGIRRRFTRPRCPWTNGKAERFNRTLQTEFAYAQPWTGNQQRLAALPGWVHDYNTQRPHTALGGQPPITRLTP
ncbi:hypothetical protein ADL03_27195 [Nocardia sp. NRRL S-836]|nr:hypothetical protein ADL03_27195 [Nocardia sp. NRRL S-836]